MHAAKLVAVECRSLDRLHSSISVSVSVSTKSAYQWVYTEFNFCGLTTILATNQKLIKITFCIEFGRIFQVLGFYNRKDLIRDFWGLEPVKLPLNASMYVCI